MRRYGLCVLSALVLGAFSPDHAHADMLDDWDGWTFNVTLENDMFGSDTDRHYTHGTRFSLAPPEGEVSDWLRDVAGYFPFFSDDGRLRSSYALGQNMYSPADITLTDPADMDRPYGGWLYGSFGLVSDMEEQVDTFELTLGMVGPASLAEPTQKFVHRVVGSAKPMGWDHQLKNEPGLVVTYERKWHRFINVETGVFGLDLDTSPYAGVSLGNIFTHVEAGTVFRFGQDLEKDRGGPPRIRPSLPGSDYYTSTDGFVWYLFAGGGARAVARNIFLDGNTLADSYSVDKKPFVFDVQAGLAMRYHDVRVAFTQIIRTKEFKKQQSPDRYGAITVSYQF